MASTLTNFYERGTDVADIYIGKDEIKDLVLSNTFDLNKLSDVGFQEISCNTIWGWGSNSNSILGQSSDSSVKFCSPIFTNETNKLWTRISSSSNTISAIKSDGTLWSWGNGAFGRLGDGTTNVSRSPKQELTCSVWTDLSSACEFTVARKTDGSVWSWGLNACGNLGDGSTISKCSPVREISCSVDWIKIFAGAGRTLAIKSDFSLWAWGGNNSNGELGDGTTVPKCSPVREISLSNTWCTAAAGGSGSTGSTSAIKSDGTLWSWGCNNSNQLANGSVLNTSSPVREISSSTNWCAVSMSIFVGHGLKTDGTLWSWGGGFNGTLGDGSVTGKCSPVQEITCSTNWKKLATGTARHMSAIKTDGTLWTWGINLSGNLGDGTTTERCSPIQEIRGLDTWVEVSRGGYSTFALKR